MAATSFDLSAIRVDSTAYASSFRTLIGVYSEAEVDSLLALIGGHQVDATHDGYLTSVDWIAFSAKASTASPAFTGTPTAPTASGATNTTQIATTAFVQGVVASNLVGALLSSNNLSDLTNAATARTNLSLGSLATQSGTFSGTSSGTNTGDNAVNSLYSGLVSNATHTGDATGSTVLTLATVNSNVGSFGSATVAPVLTVNAKGLVTAASSSTITPAIGSITGLGTGWSSALVAAYAAASGSVNGYLSSADWTTFNGKQAALGYTAANDANVLHTTGNETASGIKTFTGEGVFIPSGVTPALDLKAGSGSDILYARNISNVNVMDWGVDGSGNARARIKDSTPTTKIELNANSANGVTLTDVPFTSNKTSFVANEKYIDLQQAGVSDIVLQTGIVDSTYGGTIDIRAGGVSRLKMQANQTNPQFTVGSTAFVMLGTSWKCVHSNAYHSIQIGTLDYLILDGTLRNRGDISQSYNDLPSNPSSQFVMSGVGVRKLQVGDGSGTWQTGYTEEYNAGGIKASFFGKTTRVAQQSGDIATGLVALGLFSSATGGGGSGTVTASTGSLTSNAIVLGAGTIDTKVAAGITTDGTSKITLGVAGTSVGALAMTNATSGSVTIQPVAGALGAAVLSAPAVTDTLVTLAATQTLTNKTLTSPTLTTPALGTPASGVLTNCTGTASGLTAGTVTTNANLTGDVTSVGNATTIAASAVTLAKMANVATASVFYRKTAATGAPEVQTLATLKTDLGLTGTNSGDQDLSSYLTSSVAVATYQPLDGDLTALAALAGTNNIYYRSAANTWTSVTIGSGLSFSAGTLSATGGGTGTVTATGGNLTANSIVIGAGTVDTKVLPGFTTDGTSKLTLGVAGTSVGGLELKNATSGSVTIQPTTGALGTSVLTAPATTDTLALLAATQTLTNKTLTTPIIGQYTYATLSGMTASSYTGCLAEVSDRGYRTAFSDGSFWRWVETGAKIAETPSSTIVIKIPDTTTGAKKLYLEIPFALTITGWKLVADVSGSLVIDLWKDSYANFPPTVADTITASAKPTLSSAIKNTSSTLTGWTTSLAAGDYLEINVDSVTTVANATLSLYCDRA